MSHRQSENGDAEVHVDVVHQRIGVLILRYAVEGDETKLCTLVPGQGEGEKTGQKIGKSTSLPERRPTETCPFSRRLISCQEDILYPDKPDILAYN